MDTSRVDGVKAPQHRGTPRSIQTRVHKKAVRVGSQLGSTHKCFPTELLQLRPRHEAIIFKMTLTLLLQFLGQRVEERAPSRRAPERRDVVGHDS